VVIVEEFTIEKEQLNYPYSHGEYTVKKGYRFSRPQPGRMSLTKLTLAGNNLINSGQGEFG
jgi:hypothetical protein